MYLLAGLLSCGLLAAAALAGAATAGTSGSLDTSFGTGGTVLTGLGTGAGGGATGAALQSNGDIVVSGAFGLARYLPGGQLDQSFGTGGLASAGFAFDSENAAAVAIQPDGKILVAGSARQGQDKFAPIQGAIARYNPGGSLDTGFGAGGTVLSGTGTGAFTALGLDAAGDIFVLPALAEFSPAGQPDATVTPAAITASSQGGTAAFLPGGQFVVGSSASVARHDVDVQVQRFNAGGSLASASPQFDYSGATGVDQATDGASAVAVAASGQALVAGAHFLGTSVFGLARVNADGSLDASFGTGGTLTTSFNGDDGAGALLVQPDGKIVAAGSSEDNSTGHIFIALARYNP